jgi:hypothetical protein
MNQQARNNRLDLIGVITFSCLLGIVAFFATISVLG